MAREKVMDRTEFDRIISEKTGYAEKISALQKEKQAALDEFDRERARYRRGEISRAELARAVPKVKKEIARLDKEIRRNITGVEAVSRRSVRFARRQAPTSFIINARGVKRGGSRRRATRRAAARRTTRRRAARRSTRRTRRR